MAAGTRTASSLARLLPRLVCPACRSGSLSEVAEDALSCDRCGRRFPVLNGAPVLFHPDNPLGERLREAASRPGGVKHAVGGEYHWKEYRVAELLPPAAGAEEILLVGCGDGGERPFLESRGFRVSGFDVRPSPGTDFLADAHELPLQDGSYDVVLSMQVLEHLKAPWTAVHEVARVLRPGGWFVGSVAFLKPYHGSYFHISHLGMTQLLEDAGLEIDHLSGAQSLTYTMYGGTLPLLNRRLSRAVYGRMDRVLGGARARLWSLSRRVSASRPTDRFHAAVPLSFREFDRLRYAPAVVFRARKPVEV